MKQLDSLEKGMLAALRAGEDVGVVAEFYMTTVTAIKDIFSFDGKKWSAKQ